MVDNNIKSSGLHHRPAASSENLDAHEAVPQKTAPSTAQKTQATKPESVSTAAHGVLDTADLRSRLGKLNLPVKTGLEGMQPPTPGAGGVAVQATRELPQTSKVNNAVSSISHSKYDIKSLPGGEFRLVHKETGEAYRITIRPRKELVGENEAGVAEAIGNLLGLLDTVSPTPQQAGGIKSVSFSGNKGSVLYHNHPTGQGPIKFGGSDDENLCNGIKGSTIRDHLAALEQALGHASFGVTLESENPEAAREAAKETTQHAKQQAESKAGEEKTAQADRPVESAASSEQEQAEAPKTAKPSAPKVKAD